MIHVTKTKPRTKGHVDWTERRLDVEKGVVEPIVSRSVVSAGKSMSYLNS